MRADRRPYVEEMARALRALTAGIDNIVPEVAFKTSVTAWEVVRRISPAEDILAPDMGQFSRARGILSDATDAINKRTGNDGVTAAGIIALLLETSVKASIAEEQAKPKAAIAPRDNRVFVVHGHDGPMLRAVKRFLQKIKLEPVVLADKPGKNRTIFEKLLQEGETPFALVLLSPDDKVFRKKGDRSSPFRPRQNVVFELGYFIGRLDRENVRAIKKGDIEVLSDFHGVEFIDYKGDWKKKLLAELLAADLPLVPPPTIIYADPVPTIDASEVEKLAVVQYVRGRKAALEKSRAERARRPPAP